MNIVHAYSAFHPCTGGIEREVFQLSRGLVERGHSVTVITSNLVDSRPQKLPKEEIIDGIKVRRFSVLSPYPVSKLVFTPSLVTAMSSIKVDVIHVFSFLPYFLTNYVSLYAIRKGIPLVLTPNYHPDRQNVHRGIIAFLVRNLYDKQIGSSILKRANYVMAIVPSEADYYREKGIENICIRWTGIDEEEECSPEELEDFIKRYDLTENTILSLSRIERRKGIQHIIEAVPLILKEFPDTKLLVAGGDMGYRGYLEKLCDKMRVKKSVVFTGNLSRHQSACAFKVSKIFLLPSYYDILPLASTEAWLYRKPIIISSKVWGQEEIVTPDNGVLIKEPGDYRAIAKAVIELFSDPARAREMGENGHRLVKELLSWDSFVDKTEEIYRNLVISG